MKKLCSETQTPIKKLPQSALIQRVGLVGLLQLYWLDYLRCLRRIHGVRSLGCSCSCPLLEVRSSRGSPTIGLLLCMRVQGRALLPSCFSCCACCSQDDSSLPGCPFEDLFAKSVVGYSGGDSAQWCHWLFKRRSDLISAVLAASMNFAGLPPLYALNAAPHFRKNGCSPW